MPEADLQSLDDVRYARSLRASRARRAKAAVTRRRGTRSRAAAVGVLAGLAGLASGATAQQAAAPGGGVAAVQAALGITADGIAGPQTRRAVRAFERRQGLPVDGRIDERVRAALGVSATSSAPADAAESADAPAVLEAIALCESGGDPTAVSPDGRYRGKYQFTRSTWRSLGGSGDPAAAPEAEQDRLAAALFAQRGTAPWPACSRKVGA